MKTTTVNYHDLVRHSTSALPQPEAPEVSAAILAKIARRLDEKLAEATHRAFGRSPYDNGRVIDGECQVITDAPQIEDKR